MENNSEGELVCASRAHLNILNRDFAWKELSSPGDIVSFIDMESYYFAGIENNGETGGLWTSEDKGATWELVKYLPKDIKVVGFYPLVGGGVYIYTNKNGVYLYRNDEYMDITTPFSTVYDVSYLDNNIAVGTDRGVYYSNDGGSSWDLVWSEDTVSKVFLFKKDKLYLAFFTSEHSKNIYITDFNTFNTGGLRETTHDFCFFNMRLYAATDRGVWYTASLDTPQWCENSGFLFDEVKALGVMENTLIAGSSDGVYKLTNDFWEKIPYLNSVIVSDILNYRDSIFISTEGSGVYVLKGNQWEYVPSHAYVYGMDTLLNGTLFVITTGKIEKRTSSGWDIFRFGEDTLYDLKTYNNNIFVASSKGLIESSDKGRSYNYIYNKSSVFTCVIDSPYIYIGTVNGVLKSKDFGKTFISASIGLPGDTLFPEVRSIQLAQCKLYCSFGRGEKGVFYSLDSAKTWHSCFTEACISNIDVFSSYMVFAQSLNDTLFISLDTGKVFFPFLVDNDHINRVYVKDKSMYMVGNCGVSKIVDTLPPEFSVKFNGDFSPDGDGKNDSLAFSIDFEDTLPVAFWSIDIERNSDTFYYNVFNSVPEDESWDGYSSSGRLIGNDTLTLTIGLKDAFLNEKKHFFQIISSPEALKTNDTLCFFIPTNKIVHRGDTSLLVYTGFHPEEVMEVRAIDNAIQTPECVSNSRDLRSVEPVVEEKDSIIAIAWIERGKEDALMVSVRIDTPIVKEVYRASSISHPSIVIGGDSIYVFFSSKNEILREVFDIRRLKWNGEAVNISHSGGVSDNPYGFWLKGPVCLYTDNTKGKNLLYTYNLPDVPYPIDILAQDMVYYKGAVFMGLIDSKNTVYFASYDTINGFSKLESIETSLKPEWINIAIDSMLNIYMVLKEKKDLYIIKKNHDSQWQKPEKVNTYPSYYACIDEVLKDRKLYWVEGVTETVIRYENIDLLKDTLAPVFKYSLRDTLYIGDTISFDIETERLEYLNAFIVDKDGDTLFLKCYEIPYGYRIESNIYKLSLGEGELVLLANDLSGNHEEERKKVTIARGKSIYSLSSTYVYPNPVNRGDNLYIRIKALENCNVEVYLLNIKGKVLAHIKKYMPGGNINEVVVNTERLNHDIYLVVIKFKGEDSKKTVRIIKKVIVK